MYGNTMHHITLGYVTWQAGITLDDSTLRSGALCHICEYKRCQASDEHYPWIEHNRFGVSLFRYKPNTAWFIVGISCIVKMDMELFAWQYLTIRGRSLWIVAACEMHQPWIVLCSVELGFHWIWLFCIALHRDALQSTNYLSLHEPAMHGRPFNPISWHSKPRVRCDS